VHIQKKKNVILEWKLQK